jgi:hypothetical protein
VAPTFGAQVPAATSHAKSGVQSASEAQRAAQPVASRQTRPFGHAAGAPARQPPWPSQTLSVSVEPEHVDPQAVLAPGKAVHAVRLWLPSQAPTHAV